MSQNVSIWQTVAKTTIIIAAGGQSVRYLNAQAVSQVSVSLTQNQSHCVYLNRCPVQDPGQLPDPNLHPSVLVA